MKLSPRQREIANLTADGWRPERIAKELGMTSGTVRRAISRILKKKGLATSLELCAYVWRKRVKKSVPPETTQELTS